MVAYSMPPASCRCSLPDCDGSMRPLQPNHRPPPSARARSSSAACSATARPPARASPGNATRLETTTSRLMARPRSYRVLPRPAERHRGDDQADVRVGLRKVAPQLAGVECEVLGQQPEVVAPPQHVAEHLARLFPAADRHQRVDVPEGAD